MYSLLWVELLLFFFVYVLYREKSDGYGFLMFLAYMLFFPFYSSSATVLKSIHNSVRFHRQYRNPLLLRTLTTKSFRKIVSFVLMRSVEHTSELQSRFDLVCRLLLVL